MQSFECRVCVPDRDQPESNTLPMIIKQLFDTIRWPLLWREKGIPAPKFLTLSAATSWLGLLTVGCMGGTNLLWTWQR